MHCLIRLGAGWFGFGTTVGVWKRNPGIGNMDQSENSGMDLGVDWGRFRSLGNSLGVANGCRGSEAGAAKGILLIEGGYGGKPGCLGGGRLGIALQLVGGKSIGPLYREMGVFSGTFQCPKDILNG